MDRKRSAMDMIHWTWELPQTLIGFFLFLFVKIFDNSYEANKNEEFEDLIIKTRALPAGISLGYYVFIKDYSRLYKSHKKIENTLKKHELGHARQSFLLGPFYLIVIGLPSIIWNIFFRRYRRRNNISYYSFYTERWADAWGGVKR